MAFPQAHTPGPQGSCTGVVVGFPLLRILWTGNTSGTAGDSARSGQRAARPVRPPRGLSELSRQHANHVSPSSLWAHLASEPSPAVPTTAPGKCRPRARHGDHEFRPRRLPLAMPPALSLLRAEPLAQGCPCPQPAGFTRLQRLCRSQPHCTPHAASHHVGGPSLPPLPHDPLPKAAFAVRSPGLQAWPPQDLPGLCADQGDPALHPPPALASRHLQGSMAVHWGPVLPR